MRMQRILYWLAATGVVTASCTKDAPPSTSERTRALGGDDSGGGIGGGGTSYAPPAPWLNEDFNHYHPGDLDGQGGWTFPPGFGHVQVGSDGGSCKPMIKFLDSATAEATLDVVDQTSGPQTIEFDVKRDAAASDPSIAKLAVLGAVGGLGIKFQFIAGGGLRVNYGGDTDNAILIREMAVGRWYHVRAEVSLTPGALHDSLTIYVDGHLSAAGLTPKGGAITGVTVVGFANAGTVYMDNLYGAPMRGATWV